MYWWVGCVIGSSSTGFGSVMWERIWLETDLRLNTAYMTDRGTSMEVIYRGSDQDYFRHDKTGQAETFNQSRGDCWKTNQRLCWWAIKLVSSLKSLSFFDILLFLLFLGNIRQYSSDPVQILQQTQVYCFMITNALHSSVCVCACVC